MAEKEHPELVPSTTVRARSDLLSTELSATESVMLDIDEGSYFGVDSVGKTIWDALATSQTIEAVSQLVERTYEVDSATAAADTTSFIGELLQRGLITVENNDPS